jgi:hypothetical protein
MTSPDPRARLADNGRHVVCTSCGHGLELDHRTGCRLVVCDCLAHWTVREIESVRRAYGLVGRWYD